MYLTRQPLYLLEQDILAPVDSLERVTARGVSQRFETQRDGLAVLALPYFGEAGRVHVRLKDPAGAVIAGSDAVPGVFDTSLVSDPLPADTSWLAFVLPRQAAGVYEWELVSDSPSLQVPYEPDSQKYPGGQRSVAGSRRPGVFAFRAYASAARLERLQHYFLHRDGLRHVTGLAVLALAAGVAGGSARRVQRGEPLLPPQPIALLALLALIHTLPLYNDATQWGVWDWPEVVSHYASARHSFAAGQFPLWNPYFCGGNPLWGSPQPFWPSLGFGLSLLVGDVIGTKVAFTAYLFLTLWGTYNLAQYVLKRSVPATDEQRRVAAVVAAVVFSLGGYLATKMAAGQMAMMTTAWLPWLLFFFLKSLQRPWWIVAAAVIFLLPFLHGMQYLVVACALALLVLGGTLLFGRRRRVVWHRLLLLGLLVPSLGAAKILPTLEFLQGVPERLGRTDGLPWDRVLEALTTRTAQLNYSQEWMQGAWHEYAAYIGWVPLGLAAVGLWVAARHRRAGGPDRMLLGAFSVLGLIGLLLATSSADTVVLESVPVLNQLRNPSRYVVLLVLPLSLLAGVGGWWLSRRVAARWQNLFLVLLTVGLVIDLSRAAAPALRQVYSVPEKTLPAAPVFVQEEVSRQEAYHVVRAGTGAAGYCSAHLAAWRPAATIRGRDYAEQYRGEAFSLEPTTRVELWSFTPNRLGLAVTGAPGQETTVLINQKYAPGWRSSVGHVFNYRDQLAIRLESTSESQRLELYFLPTSFVVGTFISLLTMLFLGGVWLRGRRRAHQTTAAR